MTDDELWAELASDLRERRFELENALLEVVEIEGRVGVAVEALVATLDSYCSEQELAEVYRQMAADKEGESDE